ncbi:MAG: hypothetical protein R3F56_14160 [Planctomycetota bacterium]
MRLLPSLATLTLPLAAQGWSPPTLATALNTTATDTGGHLSADGLTAHWSSFVSGNYEIWSATRTTRASAWSAPILETALSDASAVDSEPFLCADGLTIYFASSRVGTAGSFDIMRATRPTTGSTWGAPTFVTELNSTDPDSAPSLTADELEIYFLTTGWGAPNPPQNAIAVAKRSSRAVPFGVPTIVAELSTPNTHRDVQVSPDGLSILYTEYDSSIARIRVWQAVRTNRSAPFGTPAPRTEFDAVGTSLGVYSVSVTQDGRDMLLAAGFPAAAGGQELLESLFDGLVSEGAPGLIDPVRLHVYDSGSPGSVYALALALGNTGFALGTRTVPIDGDALFVATLGVGLPPFSSGFLGNLDAQGAATGILANPLAALRGLHLYACAFTLVPSAPRGVRTISNPIELELQ